MIVEIKPDILDTDEAAAKYLELTIKLPGGIVDFEPEQQEIRTSDRNVTWGVVKNYETWILIDGAEAKLARIVIDEFPCYTTEERDDQDHTPLGTVSEVSDSLGQLVGEELAMRGYSTTFYS